MLRSGIMALVLGLLCLGQAFALKGNPKNAKTETCVACHSTDGNSIVGMWPKIAGQHEQYLLEQITHLTKPQAESVRFEPTMYPMVKDLTQQEIADLAAFYSQQKTSSGKAGSDFVSLGEKIYRGGNLNSGVSACIACHGPKGLGNELAKYPKLSGQNVEYTISTLKKYRNDERKSDPNAIMRNIAAKMTDEEIEAVSHYIAGLH